MWTQLRATVPVRAGILALDDTGFPKQGRHSVGVQRQYCGALGKIGNCQVAVSSALLADGGPWPLTFELYLPQSWMTDPDRRRAAGIPDRLRLSGEVAHRARARPHRPAGRLSTRRHHRRRRLRLERRVSRGARTAGAAATAWPFAAISRWGPPTRAGRIRRR